MQPLADTATWIGVGFAASAAVLALAASIVLLVVVLRRPPSLAQPATPSPQGPRAAEEVGEALEQARS